LLAECRFEQALKSVDNKKTVVATLAHSLKRLVHAGPVPITWLPVLLESQRDRFRDDRVATVVSGTWSIGYCSRFGESNLKALPPGSC
jgi:hypothetical protein